jgi:hypothetical protein
VETRLQINNGKVFSPAKLIQNFINSRQWEFIGNNLFVDVPEIDN